MSDLIPGLSYLDFVAEAGRHRTEASFRNSALFRRHGAALEDLLRAPVRHGAVAPAAGNGAGAGAGPLRIVHWNIEKGKKLDGIRAFLSGDSWAREADVICLNEVDVGMARSGNTDVALELARATGLQGIFLPNYVECTKGLARERAVPGENALGLHGTAVLSRLPVGDAAVSVLPPVWDYFNFPEKRFGGRRGLYLKLEARGRSFVVATTHIEMRGNPAGRARQFGAFMDGLDLALARWGRDLPAILTGDWNTHTFRRGGRFSSVSEFLRIVRTRPAARLDRDLVAPFRREPLFGRLEAAGFRVADVNEAAPTAAQALDTVEDLSMFPEWFGRWLVRAGGLQGRVLRMRLDWIAVRGFTAASAPRTVDPRDASGEPLSDHSAIGVDLAFGEAGRAVPRD